MGKICNLPFHTRANTFQRGPPHSFFWGHLKTFGEAIESTGGGSIDRSLKDFTQYAPDKVLLYSYLHPSAHFSLDIWPLQPPLIVVWGAITFIMPG